jgi:hypothetical protein
MNRARRTPDPSLNLRVSGGVFPIKRRCLGRLGLFRDNQSLLTAEEYEVQTPVPLPIIQAFVEIVEGGEIAISEETYESFRLLSEEFRFKELTNACTAFAESRLTGYGVSTEAVIGSVLNRMSALEERSFCCERHSGTVKRTIRSLCDKIDILEGEVRRLSELWAQLSDGLTKRLQPGDVVDDLTSAARDRPLSANQGKALNDRIVKIAGYFRGGAAKAAKAAKAADVAATARKLETARTVGVSLSGFTSGSGEGSFDGSGNVNIAIATQGASSDGCAAESSIAIPNYENDSGWVSLGTFTMKYSGTFKISYISGMEGVDWTIIHGTRSGGHHGTPNATIINNQERN